MKNYECYDFDGQGYKKLFHHQNWRVSILNYIAELEIDQITYFESHQNTDEVFVLLDGSCMIFFAEVKSNEIRYFETLKLEKNKVYRIEAGVYHTHTLSKDAKLLIIEEENTCEDNSPKIIISEKDRNLLIKTCQEKMNEL